MNGNAARVLRKTSLRGSRQQSLAVSVKCGSSAANQRKVQVSSNNLIQNYFLLRMPLAGYREWPCLGRSPLDASPAEDGAAP